MNRSGECAARRGVGLGAGAALLVAGCGALPNRDAVVAAEPWPTVAARFAADRSFRGGDAAYAVDLGGARKLWLFGDSFVARGEAASRRDCVFVRNAMALQTGADPATATFSFHFGRGADGPSDWLAGTGKEWRWPLGGCATGDTAVVFCTRVVATGDDGPFGFRAVGWTAVRIVGIDSEVEQWRQEAVQLPRVELPFPIVVGTAVVRAGDHVHAFALREPGDHALFLARWSASEFAKGDLRAIEWWDGERFAAASAPKCVLGEAAPEFSVLPTANGFAMVQSLGFPRGDLAVRTAPALEGPWSAPTVVYRPPEVADAGLLVYAGKATALADGSWLATYASNAFDLARLVDDEKVYFPHCVRLRWR